LALSLETKDQNSEIYREHQIFYNFVQQPEVFIPFGLEYILHLFGIARQEDKKRIYEILLHFLP